jgi:hypothetical protein
MIDLSLETVLPFRAACAQLPRRRAGRQMRPSTLYRWSRQGLRGVRLETIQVGGTQCTSIEALQRFFVQLSAPAEDRDRRDVRPTP